MSTRLIVSIAAAMILLTVRKRRSMRPRMVVIHLAFFSLVFTAAILKVTHVWGSSG